MPEEDININLNAGKLIQSLKQHKTAILEAKGVNNKLIAQMKKLASVKEANDSSSILGKILAGGLVLGALKSLVGMSPMLKQMTKLMQFSVMLILRPIGDFIGFILRPVMVYMLRKFIIPWYKDVYPVMKTLGTDIGNEITNTLSDLTGENGLGSQISALGKVVAGIGITGIAIKGAGVAGKSMGKIAGRITRNVFVKGAGVAGTKAGTGFSKGTQKVLDDFKKAKPNRFAVQVAKFNSSVRKLGTIKLPNIKIPMPAWLSNLIGGGKTKPPTPQPPKPNTSSKWMTGGKFDAAKYAKMMGKSGTSFGMAGKIAGGAASAALTIPMMMGEQYAGDNPQTVRERTMQEGSGIDNILTVIEDLRSIITNTPNKNNVNITIQSIPDKSTADYMIQEFQGFMNK